MWHSLKVYETINQKTIDEIVDEAMQEQNLKVEVKDENGRWMDINDVEE